MDRAVLPIGVLAFTLLWLGMLQIPFGIWLLGTHEMRNESGGEP